MTLLWAALALGVTGSLHCAAMCGPLVATLRRGVFVRDTPAASRSAAGRAHDVVEAATYQIARILTYAAFGLAAGRLGQMALVRGAGRGMAIAGGALLMAMAVAQLANLVLPGARRLGRIAGAAMQFARRVRGRRPIAAAGLGGVANAFLPCGLVYAALVAALSTGRPADAAAFMLLFGLGTTPMLVAFWAAAGIRPLLAPGVRRIAAPIAMALVGALLLGRAGVPGMPATPAHHMPMASMAEAGAK